MSLDGSYDMVLLPPPRASDSDGRQPARRRRTRRRLPSMAEEQHPGLSRRLPRRRRRRGNRAQAGGDTSSTVERVDDTGAPAGDTSGVDLAPETTTSVVSPQHANLKRTDDASTLAKGLDEKVRRGYHPRRWGRYNSGEDRSPSPEPPGQQAFSRAIRRAPFPTRFRAPTTITKYSGETRPELWLADYRLAC
jgi:hypothetical protein